MPMIIDYKDQVMTAYLKGEIDHHLARTLREEIDAAAERQKPQLLILDFRDVSFMDSSGIGLVMGRYRVVSAWGGRMQVVNTSPHIGKVMRLAGLERLDVLSKGGVAK